jgi:protein SCO1/2
MSEITAGYYRDEQLLQRLMRSKSFWIVAWLFLFSYPIYRTLHRELPPPLPIFYKVPEFNLTNEFNKSFGTKDLQGKYYIANFMFTSCPTTCPALMEKMDIIQNRIRGLGTKAAIVTFTVDPSVDTPEVLYKFARKRNTNPYVWNFLTGTEADLKKIVIEGFKVPMGNKETIQKTLGANQVSLIDIAHSDKVVLVDDKGQIRGYYSTDKENMNHLMIDLGLLVNNSFRKTN